MFVKSQPLDARVMFYSLGGAFSLSLAVASAFSLAEKATYVQNPHRNEPLTHHSASMVAPTDQVRNQ